jgi:hypothetical protein
MAARRTVPTGGGSTFDNSSTRKLRVNTTSADGDRITVEFTRDELDPVKNALNEVCNGIRVPEFSTRLGATWEEARSLLEEIQQGRRRLQRPG